MRKNTAFAGGIFPACTIVIIVSFLVLLNGCKKKDLTSSKQEKQQSENFVPDWVKEKFRSTPQKILFPVDKTKRIPVNIIDRNGKKMTAEQARLLDMPCDPEGGNYNDNEMFFESEGVVFTTATAGARITATINLYTGFDIELLDPITSDPSNIQLFVYSSNVLQSDDEYPISAGDIIDKGLNPSNPDQHWYQISFVSSVITTSLSSLTFKYQAHIFTDCIYPTIDSDIFDSNISGFPGVCGRIDVVDITTGGMGNPGYIYFDGCNAALNYGGLSLTPPDQHEIQWYKPGDMTYGTAQNLLFATYCTPSVMLPSYGTSPKSFPVTGTIWIRYRNLDRNTSNPCTATTTTCSGPWSPWEPHIVY